MSDDFSDLPTDLRELCIGFVDQIKSGKPVTVLKMVMKSRGLTEAQVTRVVKAAGGTVTAAPAAAAPSKSSEKEKEKKEKKKDKKSDKSSSSSASSSASASSSSAVPAAPPMAPPLAAAAPVIAAAPTPAPEPAAQPPAPTDDAAKEKKKKRSKKDKSDDSSSAAATSSSADRFTSIETLESSKKLKTNVQPASSVVFAQKHLGATPTHANSTTPSSSSHPTHARRGSQVKLKAYDDDTHDADEKMFGGNSAEKKKKEGCVIC